MIRVDINCDLGEGNASEIGMLPYLSSCNIACGGHTGHIESMKETLKRVRQYDIKVGAHPSYPDPNNFGRKVMDISRDALRNTIISQIYSLRDIASELNISLNHVKLHGALYNKAACDLETANIVIDCIMEIDKSLKLYVPYNSLIARQAVHQLEIVVEGFADRLYNDDYSLVSRTLKGAVITDSKIAIAQVLSMLQDNTVITLTGKKLPFKIQTLCVHSDTDNARFILKELYLKLMNEGIRIA